MYRIQLHLFSNECTIFAGNTKLKVLPLQFAGAWVKATISKNGLKTIQQKEVTESSRKFLKNQIFFNYYK